MVTSALCTLTDLVLARPEFKKTRPHPGRSVHRAVQMENLSRIEIRKIEISEYSICANIYEQAWNVALPNHQRTISIADFKSEIEGELTLVAVLDGQITGYISIWKPDWFIHQLYVDTTAHRRGIGKALISYLERLAAPHRISLKCQIANTGANGFYKALGFSPAHEDGVDEFGKWERLEKSLVE